MKRNYYNIPIHVLINLILIFVLLVLSSCSGLSKRKSLLGNSDEAESKKKPKTVSKVQYDQLLQKYKILLKSKGMGAGEGLHTDPLFRAKDPSEMVEHLSRVKNTPQLAETVDVFENGPMSKNSRSYNKVMLGSGPAFAYSEDEVEQQLKTLRKANLLVNQNKHSQAVNILKSLEASGIDQIKVHAKFLLGELLFQQESYDLAMQVFEDIIGTYSFSGLVTKILGRLIVCCEKLKLSKKREQYFSVLHDFFE